MNPANQKRVLGLVEMTCGLVHASYSLPEWQAVKLTFFAPCASMDSKFLKVLSRGLFILLGKLKRKRQLYCI